MTRSTGFKATPTERWQTRTWIAYGAVMLAFALNTGFSAPSNLDIVPTIMAGMTFWLLQTLPLWLFFPAIKRRQPRRLSWLGYLLLIYLIFAIYGMTTPPLWAAIFMSASTLALFFSNAYWVRALKKQKQQSRPTA